MARISYKTERQKEFGRHFDSLCGSRSRWQAWSDFVHLAGYAISNMVDEVHRDKREHEYQRIAKGYTDSEMETMSKLLAVTSFALNENPEQDFLGELYMMLDLGNSDAGQFFTPYHICDFMSRITFGANTKEQIERKGWISVNDPCVGGGALLIAFINTCAQEGINYKQNVLVVGQDIDHSTAMMAYIQLSILGCAGYIVVGNSLSEPLTGDTLFAPMDREVFVTPMYCDQIWDRRRTWHTVEQLLKSEFRPKTVAPPNGESVQTSEQIVEQDSEKIEDDNYVPIQMSLFDT